MWRESGAFSVDPPACEIVYSCSMISGPRMDLCDLQDEHTTSSFDVLSSKFSFESTSVTDLPAGSYVFEISATVGLKSAALQFKMILQDPCPTSLELLSNPFLDMVFETGGEAKTQSYNLSQLVTKSTAADCGPKTIEFMNEDQSSLIADLFTVSVSESEEVSLIVDSSEDRPDLVGLYRVKYRIGYERYPEAAVEMNELFSVTVIDPCQESDI